MRARGVLRRLLLDDRAQLAAKAGLAAALSWAAARLVAPALPVAALADYTYYAPLGAVVATHPTVAASLRSARQSALALALGGALGLLMHHLLPESVLSLALVVGAGVALGAVPGLGTQASWVPIVALFVLLIGGRDATSYAAAYVGLTALGALCGVAVNLLFPATRLHRGRQAIARLQRLLADQLVDLAEGMRIERLLGAEGWRRRMRDLQPALEATRQAVREGQEARRGNPRARFHSGELRRQQDVERALQRVALLVEDVHAMLVETYADDLLSAPMDRDVALATAEALDRLARLVAVYDVGLEPDDRRVRDAEEAVRLLTDTFGRRRDLDAADVAVVGAVVANLRRSTTAVLPGRRV